jgi:hypothetical protein
MQELRADFAAFKTTVLCRDPKANGAERSTVRISVGTRNVRGDLKSPDRETLKQGELEFLPLEETIEPPGGSRQAGIALSSHACELRGKDQFPPRSNDQGVTGHESL